MRERETELIKWINYRKRPFHRTIDQYAFHSTMYRSKRNREKKQKQQQQHVKTERFKFVYDDNDATSNKQYQTWYE